MREWVILDHFFGFSPRNVKISNKNTSLYQCSILFDRANITSTLPRLCGLLMIFKILTIYWRGFRERGPKWSFFILDLNSKVNWCCILCELLIFKISPSRGNVPVGLNRILAFRVIILTSRPNRLTRLALNALKPIPSKGAWNLRRLFTFLAISRIADQYSMSRNFCFYLEFEN